jgi:hypothetical protein
MTHREYGPQGPAAERFLEALERLDTPEIVALGAAGGGVVGTDELDPQVVARAQLRLELRELARHAGRLDAIRAIGREVEHWAGSAQHWFPAGVAGTSELAASIGPRLAALQVVLDAAYGVVLADQLRESDLALLLGPWRDLAGDPFEPGSRFAADDVADLEVPNDPDDPAADEGAEEQPG